MRAARATAAVVVAAAMVAGAPGVAAGQEVMPITAPDAAAATSAPPGVGVAEVPAEVDTVRLRDGGVIRGTVAEALPGRHVTIVSVTGQRYTFGWDQVVEVGYAGGAPAAAPVIPPVLVPGPGRPRLHIELTRSAPVRLYEMTGTIMVGSGSTMTTTHLGANAARPVCMAPCDKVIDGTGGQSFFFGGDRVMPSKRFTLHEHDGDMTAVVRPGRAGMFIGGLMLASMSLAPMLSGGIFLGVQRPGTSTSEQRMHRTGAVLLGAGAAALVSGIVMMALGRTRVELYRKMTGAAQRRAKPGRM